MNATHVCGLVVGWLSDYYLAATLLLCATLAGWRWIRQPAHRVMAAWIVLVELIALALACAMPFWPRVSLIAAAPQEVAVTSPVIDEQPRLAQPRIVLPPEAQWRDVPRESLTPDVDRSTVPSAAPKHRWMWTELIAVGYLAGAAVSGLWLGWGAAATTWLCKQAQPVPDALQAELARICSRHTPCAVSRFDLHASTNLSTCQAGGTRRVPATPCLLLSRHVPYAVAVGVLRPTIILPAALTESSPTTALHAVLAHEWAHIRNRDLWLLAVGRCLLVVLFAHPVFWWLRRAIRSDQELLADAVAAGDNRQGYAEDLLRLIRKTTHPSPMAISAAMGLWEGSSQLSRRIAMLLDETFHVDPTGSRRWKRHALAVLVALGTACSIVTMQPARSAEEQASLAVAPSDAADDRADDSFLFLVPRYQTRLEPALEKQLKLTADQKKRLEDISRQFYFVDMQKFYQEHKNAPRHEALAAFSRWERGRHMAVRKQVDAILTPRQKRTLRDLAFPEAAESRLQDRTNWERLRLTKDQEDGLLLLEGEADRRYNSRATADKLLAVLTPQQRRQLRDGPLGSGGRTLSTTTEVGDDGGLVDIPTPFPYPDISDEAVQNQLKLDATQRSRLREILGDSPNLTALFLRASKPDRSSKEGRTGGLVLTGLDEPMVEGDLSLNRAAVAAKKLSPEERARLRAETIKELTEKMDRELERQDAELARQPLMRLKDDLLKRFESLLTSEQLAAYKDLAVRNMAEMMLCDPKVLAKIAASDQQKAELRRILESEPEPAQVCREMGEKMLKLLTPQQREELRRQIDNEMSGRSLGEQANAAAPAESKAEKKAAPAAAKPTPEPPPDADMVVMGGSHSTAAGGDDEEGPKDIISLPEYPLLMQRPVVKQLNITADQRKKLLDIAARFRSDTTELSKEAERKKLSREELSKLFARRQPEMFADVRKRAQEVLTPAQSQTLKELSLRGFAATRLLFPDAAAKLDLTRQQQEELHSTAKECHDRDMKLVRKIVEKMVAVFDPQQQSQLREAAIGPLGPNQGAYNLITLKGESNPTRIPFVFPYPDFSQKEVRKQLGLGPEQEKRVQDIMGGDSTLTDKLVREAQKIPSAERTTVKRGGADFARDGSYTFSTEVNQHLMAEREKESAEHRKQPLVKRTIELRRQFEKLLTPAQLASYRDMAFQNIAEVAVSDPVMLDQIGATAKQRAAVRRHQWELYEVMQQFACEMGEKELKLLTPEQREKLQQEIDRRMSGQGS